jgi:plastocyanin
LFQLVERNATKIQLADLRTRQTVNVAVKDNVFIPRGIRIDPGSKVVFTNEGWSPHDIKASNGAQDFGARFRCRSSSERLAPLGSIRIFERDAV